MNNILWLVGQQLAGKTSLANFLRIYDVYTLNIGEQLRKNHTPNDFLKSENSYAPHFVETQVQGMIQAFIRDNVDQLLLIIDSAPRNPAQFDIMMKYREQSQIVIIKQPFALRQSRALMKYKGDLAYFNDREKFEQEWLKYVESLCSQEHISTIQIGRE